MESRHGAREATRVHSYRVLCLKFAIAVSAFTLAIVRRESLGILHTFSRLAVVGAIARHLQMTEPTRSRRPRSNLLLLLPLIGALHILPAHALPAACNATGSFCTAPEITPWRHNSITWYIGTGGPFDSEADLIAGIVAHKTSGPGAWCAFNPTSVTRDDNLTWGGTPWFSGSVDVFHGNTLHANSVGYPSQGCVQQWQNDAALGQWRDIKCLPNHSLIWDTSVSPAVPFCLGSHFASQPSKSFGAQCEITKGNPCSLTHGNKYQAEVDYHGIFTRSYNSLAAYYRSMFPTDGV